MCGTGSRAPRRSLLPRWRSGPVTRALLPHRLLRKILPRSVQILCRAHFAFALRLEAIDFQCAGFCAYNKYGRLSLTLDAAGAGYERAQIGFGCDDAQAVRFRIIG